MSFRPRFGDGRIQARQVRPEPRHTVSWLDNAVVFDQQRWICAEAELRWSAPHHLIVLTETGRTAETRIRSEGTVYDGRDRPGSLSFVPAGLERSGVFRGVDLSYSALWIDPELDLPGCERLPELPLVVNGSDPVIATLLTALRNEIVIGDSPAAAYIEHLAALAMLRIVAWDRPVERLPAHGRLDRAILSRIEAYVEANLASDISLSELARLAGMSVDTFARRFKASTGQAPYAYVLERRILRAEALLRGSDRAIGAIAADLGFASQSHLTTTFRRLRGVTPRGYRIAFSPDS